MFKLQTIITIPVLNVKFWITSGFIPEYVINRSLVKVGIRYYAMHVLEMLRNSKSQICFHPCIIAFGISPVFYIT